MTKPEVRLALCGAGRWGKRFLETIKIESGQTGSNLKLGAVVSRNPETTALIPPGCEVVSSWQELLKRDDIGCDGLIIATPPHTHAEIAQTAMRRGVPCLIEKPLTTSLKEALEIQALASALHSLVMVDHTLLFHPAYLELKRTLVGQTIEVIESVGCNWGPFRHDYSPLWDYAPHDVAFCLDLVGRTPAQVTATASQVSTVQHGGQAGAYAIDLKWREGPHARIKVSNLETQKCRRLQVKTNRATYVFDDLAPVKLYRLQGNEKIRVAYADEKPLTRALQFFVTAIREKRTRLGSRGELNLPVDTTEILDSKFGLALAVAGVEVLDRAQRSL